MVGVDGKVDARVDGLDDVFDTRVLLDFEEVLAETEARGVAHVGPEDTVRDVLQRKVETIHHVARRVEQVEARVCVRGIADLDCKNQKNQKKKMEKVRKG